MRLHFGEELPPGYRCPCFSPQSWSKIGGVTLLLWYFLIKESGRPLRGTGAEHREEKTYN